LLEAASREQEPLDTALYPFSRLNTLSPSVQTRLFEVARAALASDGVRRAFAVRALARAGDGGVTELGTLLSNPEFTPGMRADAARELAKLGASGQRALEDAVAKLEITPGPSGDEVLRSANWGALSALLGALHTLTTREARDALAKLADFPLEDADDAVLRRRKLNLRCAAAQLLAGSATLSAKLVACDPDKLGRIGNLATLKVLDRGKLEGARARRYAALAALDDPLVRQAALKMLPSHPEVENSAALLAAALGAQQPGVVATAAQILAAYPDRSGSPQKQPDSTADAERDSSVPVQPAALKPHPDVIRSLTQAYDNAEKTFQIEVRAALIDAAGALELLGLKPRIEHACASDNPTLREHAEKALRLLGNKMQVCDRFDPPQSTPPEAKVPSLQTTTLAFDTEIGELTIVLRNEHAPGAVTRVVELAKTGFYDNIVVHRVVPGFVAQFGDPRGDGFGGADRPPLRCETSPEPFAPFSVGLALAGRDTGSSQLFVTLGRSPHLDGEYPLLGTASEGWERLAEGDVIRKVSIR
jgi:cyclophilin family peptidyl-prolyl cis-trans isomerase